MFILILLTHSCIFALVNSNPLQGFPSYPVIQYEGNYRNEQPVLIQPSDFNSYPHMHLIQKQVAPYQNVPISYNDVQGIYLENIIQNGINSAFNTNCGQTGLYTNPADKLLPDVVNNYFIVPVESNSINETKDCNKRTVCKSQNDRKSSAPLEIGSPKKKKKCKKRKNTANINENIEKCSVDERNKRIGKNNMGDEQPDGKDVKVCKKKKSRSKLQNAGKSTDERLPVANEKQIKDKNIKSKSESVQNFKSRNSNKNCKVSKYVNNGEYAIETVKTAPSNNCRKVTKTENSCDCSQKQGLDDYFKIEEDCAELNHRCTRNYREDNIQKSQQQYYLPSDFSNNISPYMMFDHQFFDTNSYFPYNFDYLYKMQQSPKGNSNPPQKKSNSNRRVGRKKKQNKVNKNNNRNMQDSKQNCNFEKIVELSPKVLDCQSDTEIISSVTAEAVGKQVGEIYQDTSAIKREEIVALSSKDNSKETESNGSYELNQDDYSPIYDDYYPQFHSDNIYTSKEVFDWDNFHDRNYYTSSDMNELDRERRKFESLDEATVPLQVNSIKTNDFKPYIYTKIDNENQGKQEFSVKVNNEEQNDNVKYKAAIEEIQFKTPPALDFPDFKTQMINKDQLIPTIEVYYQPSNKKINKHKNNKMSTYSDTKMAEPNENINKIVSQNEVETVFGHSKVAKYGTPSNKDEHNENIAEDNNADDDIYSTDEKPIVVIAKSLPYPID